MSAMDLEGFPTLLDARYSEIRQEEYAGITNIIPSLFTERPTDRLDQFRTSVSGLGQWEEFTGQLNVQQVYEQYQVSSRPRAFGTMCIVTRRMVTYDLAGVLNGRNFRPMVRAGMLTKQNTRPSSLKCSRSMIRAGTCARKASRLRAIATRRGCPTYRSLRALTITRLTCSRQ